MNCDQVAHEVLKRSRVEETRRCIAALGTGLILVLHDATELDDTTKNSKKAS